MWSAPTSVISPSSCKERSSRALQKFSKLVFFPSLKILRVSFLGRFFFFFWWRIRCLSLSLSPIDVLLPLKFPKASSLIRVLFSASNSLIVTSEFFFCLNITCNLRICISNTIRCCPTRLQYLREYGKKSLFANWVYGSKLISMIFEKSEEAGLLVSTVSKLRVQMIYTKRISFRDPGEFLESWSRHETPSLQINLHAWAKRLTSAFDDIWTLYG